MLGWVSKGQLERARQIHVLDYVLSHEVDSIKRVGNGYRVKEHPSVAINEDGWYQHSNGVGGKTALDYLTDVHGYGLVDAVCMLLGEAPASRSVPSASKASIASTAISQRTSGASSRSPPELERKPFTLPVRNADNRRVIAYLQSRGIDKSLILDCIRQGQIFESKTFHNTVFVGRDERGKARFAAMRGTFSSFKCDVDGSSKKYGFVLPPDNPDSHEIAIFESPVDALSHQTLCKQGHIPSFDGWRLSLGGTSILALTYFLEHHSQVSHCLICTDDDEAGNRAAEKIAEVSCTTSARSPPPCGKKDWNDALIAMQKAERMQNQTRCTSAPFR